MSRELPDGAQYEPIDENGDQPVTSAEFHDAMRTVAKSFVRVEANMATSEELERLDARIDAKFTTLATRQDLLEERLTARIDVLEDTIVKALARHIDSTVDRSVRRHTKLHEERISRLEKFTGLSPIA